jgi:hypothetical protein
LRRTQHANGYFGDGVAVRRAWPVGFAALPPLTLLECGAPATDAAVQKAARFVRKHAPTLNRTYEIALAILFLDRLGEPEDRPLIRSLALRLVAGQNELGGWTYHCPVLQSAHEKKLLQFLRQHKPAKEQKKATATTPPEKGAKAKSRNEGDNSNTQFAILALWVAQRHDLPLGYTLERIEQRFRASQRPNGGWLYNLVHREKGPYGSMTCVGLLGLAVGRCSFPKGMEPKAAPGRPLPEDEGISRGLRALGGYLDDPADSKMVRADAGTSWGPDGTLNLYFLWSVERVGVLCGLKTIGGRDWYRWGVDLLLPAQKADGSWVGRGSGGSPTIDTCFALLFLKRSDLLPDLREALHKRVTITDPGPASPGESEKKGAGKQPAPKLKEAIPDPGKKAPQNPG